MKPFVPKVKKPIALLAALAVSASLGACSALSDGGSEASSSSKLVVALPTPVRSLNYVGYLDTVANYVFTGSVLEGLTGLSQRSDGSTKIEPRLAVAWSRLNPLEWKFVLRTGVTFQNGAPFTSKDVVYSWSNFKQKDSEVPKVLSNIASVTAVDKKTVEIKTKAPTAFLDRAMYALPIQPSGWDDSPDAKTTLVGTGPYELESASTALDHFVLKKSGDYWGDNADAFKSLEFKLVPEATTRSEMLQTGEANVAVELTPDLAASAPDVIRVPGSEVNVLRLGVDDNPVLQDVRVRRAINMAINRQSIIDNLWRGFAQLPNGQIIPSNSVGYNSKLTDYDYDPDQARQLISDAGATGTSLELACSPELFGDASRDACSAISQMLSDIGLEVDLKQMGSDAYLEAYYASQDGRPEPAMTFVPVGNETLTADVAMIGTWVCDEPANGMCLPKITKRVVDIAGIADPNKQDAAWQDLAVDLKDLATHVPLNVPDVIFGTDGTVTGPVYPTSGAGTGDETWADWRVK